MKRKVLIIRVLALIAFLLSAYILWTSVSPDSELAGCGEGSGCDTVLQTKWSSWFGLPVSAGAILVYAGIFIMTFLITDAKSKGWLVLVFLSFLAGASGLWFMMLQSFLIKSYCIYCSIVHLCGIIITGIVLKTIPLQEEPGGKKKKMERTGISPSQFFYAGVAGVLAVAVVAWGQMQSESATVPEISQPGVSVQPSAPVKTVQLLNGRVTVSAGEFPVLGSAEAGRMIAHLFDYTCPACRSLHSRLLQNVQQYRDSSLVMVPMPLDAVCNPGVPQTAYLHLNACQFARIGLAVWRAKPEAYAAYDHFMFQNEHPPSAEAARGVADQLVGQETMQRILNDPALDELLRRGINLFYSSPIQRKVLPILITPEKAEYGIPNSIELAALFSHP